MPDPLTLLLAGAAVFGGALVQGSVGFGLALVAAPFLTLLTADLMPGLVIVLGAILPTLTLRQEWRHVDWWGMRWALAGRALGTSAGVWLVAVLSQDRLSLLVSVVVLGAVVLSLRQVVLPRTRRSLLAAGALSGLTGTATSIGGPPVALVYQQEPGPRVRATLGAFLSAGALLSLLALGLSGYVGRDHLLTAGALVPFLLAGYLVAVPLRRHLDAGRTRRAVLAVAGISAGLLLLRVLA